MDDIHAAMLKELGLEHQALAGQEVSTIYFGGGTPSLFSSIQLDQLLKKIRDQFTVSPSAEITLEANPEDLSDAFLAQLKSMGVNRLSIGIQSFDDQTLTFLNRKHTGIEAKSAIARAREVGFQNITGDLILGVPALNTEAWKNDLAQLIELDLPHVSLYILTVEEKTAFGNWKKKGRLTELPEEQVAAQYEFAQVALEKSGYVQYEVSNYSRLGFESKHNTSYWKGAHYLGIGPGAHSYSGTHRSFNVADNSKYLRLLTQGLSAKTTEMLSHTQQMNEYLLTRLRTKSGASVSEFHRLFSQDFSLDFAATLGSLVASGLIEQVGDIVRPTRAGFLMADEISLQLFYDEE